MISFVTTRQSCSSSILCSSNFLHHHTFPWKQVFARSCEPNFHCSPKSVVIILCDLAWDLVSWTNSDSLMDFSELEVLFCPLWTLICCVIVLVLHDVYFNNYSYNWKFNNNAALSVLVALVSPFPLSLLRTVDAASPLLHVKSRYQWPMRCLLSSRNTQPMSWWWPWHKTFPQNKTATLSFRTSPTIMTHKFQGWNLQRDLIKIIQQLSTQLSKRQKQQYQNDTGRTQANKATIPFFFAVQQYTQ